MKAAIGPSAANDKTLVSEYFEAWLEDEVKNLNDIPTYKQYESMYRNNIKPVIGSYRVSSVKASDIRQVIAKMNTKVCEIKKQKRGSHEPKGRACRKDNETRTIHHEYGFYKGT